MAMVSFIKFARILCKLFSLGAIQAVLAGSVLGKSTKLSEIFGETIFWHKVEGHTELEMLPMFLEMLSVLLTITWLDIIVFHTFTLLNLQVASNSLIPKQEFML